MAPPLATWTTALQFTLAQLRNARGAYAPNGVVPKLTNQDASALILLLRKVEAYRHDQGDIRTSALAPSDWYTWAKPALGWFQRGDRFDMSKPWRDHAYQPVFAGALVQHLIQLADALDKAKIAPRLLGDPKGSPASYQQLAMDAYKRMQREDPASADVKPHKVPPGTPKNVPTKKPDVIAVAPPAPPPPPAPRPVVVPTPAGPVVHQPPPPPAPPPPAPVVVPVAKPPGPTAPQPATLPPTPPQQASMPAPGMTPEPDYAAPPDDGGQDEPTTDAQAAQRDDATPSAPPRSDRYSGPYGGGRVPSPPAPSPEPEHPDSDEHAQAVVDAYQAEQRRRADEEERKKKGGGGVVILAIALGFALADD
jgi:hypothetical protein